MCKKDFDVFYEIECAFNNKDKLIQETYFYKNELESRIYDYKDKISSDWSIYTNNADEITAMMEKRIAWLYDEGTNSTKGKYKSYLKEVEDSCKDIIMRHWQYKTIPQRMYAFGEVLNTYHQFCDSTVIFVLCKNKIK